MNKNIGGISFFLIAILAFACMNSLAKGLTYHYPIIEVVWARYLSQTIFTAIVFAPNLKTVIKTNRILLHLFRSALLFGATVFIFAGFKYLTLVETMTIFQTGPFMVIILSVIFLGEAVGVTRWISVLIGFCGALFILKPGTDPFITAGIFPLLAALCYAGYTVSTRHLGTDEDPRTNFFYTTLVGTVVSSIILFPFFKSIEILDILFFAVLGAIGGIGHYCLVLALRKSEASLLAPFTYFDLIFSSILGIIFFYEYPSITVIIGAVIIVGAGIYTWYIDPQNKKNYNNSDFDQSQ